MLLYPIMACIDTFQFIPELSSRGVDAQRGAASEQVEVAIGMQEWRVGDHTRGGDQAIQRLANGDACSARGPIELGRQGIVIEGRQTENGKGAQMAFEVRGVARR